MRTAEELRRLSALLDEALDLPPTERKPWLDGLAQQDARLAHTLREMLDRHADDAEAPVLDTSAASRLLAAAGVDDPHAWHAGQAVGPYRLLDLIGRGGMGEVWLASRDDAGPDRRVALKLPVLATRRGVLLQRFARERDILSSLAHPHIARLYDAGVTDDGQPYLALEHVEGVPITRYVDAQRLDSAGRVRLLLQVMQAVQHAHARLVIHRDLKPSNVLVTADGRAMLLDFGIAKLLQGERGEAAETELTREGGRAMTLDYAAPEQLRGDPISTATDVWALGVLSYELVAGQRPFRGTRRGEVEQRVLDADPPRLSLSGTTTDGLRRSRLQELETILGKALKKRPEDRYGTVAAFADDLNRWLRDEPVLARPDSPWYRASKLVVRHRGAVAASVAVLVAIVGAAGVALWQSQVAREQARVARTEAATAGAVQDFLEGILRANRSDQTDPMAARDKTARQLLEEAAGRISQSLDNEPQAKLRLLGTLADMLEDVELRDLALRMLEQRAELIGRLQGEGSVAHVQAVLATARRMLAQKRLPEARVLLNQADGLRKAHPTPDAESFGTMVLLEAVLATRRNAPQSVTSGLAAALDRVLAAPPTFDGVMAAFTLAALQRRHRDVDAASQTQRRALAALARLDMARLTDSQRARVDMARRAAAAGREDEAAEQMAALDPVLDARDPRSVMLMTFISPEATRVAASAHEEIFKRYLDIGGGQDARVDDLIFGSREARVSLRLRAGRITEAAQAIEASERSAEAGLRGALRARAELSVETGRFDDARRARQTLRERQNLSNKPPRLLGPLPLPWEASNELDATLAEGDAAGARALFDRLVPIRPTGFDADVAAFESRLLLLEAKPTEAVALARAAVDTMRIRRPSPTRIQLHQTLGDALLATGQAAEAIPVLETGLALVPSVYEPEISPRVALLHLALAEARFATGDRVGAQQSLTTGRAILAKHPVLGPQYLGPLARAEARVGAG